ncbi:Lengsin [Dactylellina cionopaga]|nr:Lengsin [Dactylellina cionopaga]
MTITDNNDFAQWQDFLAKHQNVEFVWIQFLSYNPRPYTRIIPVAQFTQMVKTSRYMTLPSPIWSRILGNIVPETDVCCGAFYISPDIKTAYCQAGSGGTRVVVQCDCLEMDLTPVKECPRSRLRILHETLQRENMLSTLVGFEIEVIFLKVEDAQAGVYTPITETDSWQCIRPENLESLKLIEKIAHALREVGIPLEHFHPESAPGQWEFVLPPYSPLEAVDTLLKARDTIMHIARLHGVLATLYPRVSREHLATGAHAHISINDLESHDHQHHESFFAGVIHHMPSILACTLPQDVSYERVRTGIWSGGEYACWGWENRAVAMRRITDNRFELKLIDGLANPYLALAAILAAGLDGLQKEMPLRAGHCGKPASDMDSEERETLGVDVLLPKTIDDSLAALETNLALRAVLGDALVTGYVKVKRTEIEYLRKKTDEERKKWIILKY